MRKNISQVLEVNTNNNIQFFPYKVMFFNTEIRIFRPTLSWSLNAICLVLFIRNCSYIHTARNYRKSDENLHDMPVNVYSSNINDNIFKIH